MPPKAKAAAKATLPAVGEADGGASAAGGGATPSQVYFLGVTETVAKAQTEVKTREHYDALCVPANAAAPRAACRRLCRSLGLSRMHGPPRAARAP